jgi:osmotically-inducible protein OsmY
LKKYFLALVVAAALAGPCLAATAPGNRAVAVPAQRGVSDAQIERNIKARLAKSKMTLVGKEKFTVTVKDGVATLEGKTNVIQHKGVATRLAKLSGAIAVQNRIEVSEEAKAKAAARLGRGRGGGDGPPARARVVGALP